MMSGMSTDMSSTRAFDFLFRGVIPTNQGEILFKENNP